MTASLYFIYEGERYEIALDHAAAPRTIETLLQHVPARIDLHCAKIAGRHIFWHAPFVAPLEQGRDVLTAAPGTFLYWPERQFLELTYGELQAESAQVTILGRLTGDIDWLIALGEDLRRGQGRRIFWAGLEVDVSSKQREGVGVTKTASELTGDAEAPCMNDARFIHLKTAREQAWVAEPDSVTELVARRGILLPYGPLAMAEGEFRKLQELLWRYASRHAEGFSAGAKAEHTAFLLEAFVSRIADLCGMEECRATLLGAAELLREQPDAYTAITHELILYCGRFAAWLDLYIPWNDLNEAVLEAQSR